MAIISSLLVLDYYARESLDQACIVKTYFVTNFSAGTGTS